MRLLRTSVIGLAACSGLLTIGLFAITPCNAGSIPAWLDDSITNWNASNPKDTIQFVDIKDSYVWYTMAATPELGSKEIRARVYGIAYKNGYANTQDEEIVTTGKPPVASGPVKTVKCWTRSFLRDIKSGDSTAGTSRMLTTLVCQDGANWSAGFRILQ